MTAVAYAALWLFVFSVPWERVIVITDVAIVTRATGALALGLALLAVIISGRFRRWRPFHLLALMFVLCAGVGVMTLGLPVIPKKFWTYTQLLLVLWMIWELAVSRKRVTGLFVAYVLGAYVAAIATIMVYVTQGGSLRRFAAAGGDPNDLAMTIALALPMAWYLGMTLRQPLVRWICRGFLPIGLLVLGLTGSRGGMLAGLVGMLIVPLSMTRLSPGRLATGIVMLVLSGTLAVYLVPEQTVERLATTGQEVEDLSLGGRFKLWRAGLIAFVEKPILGYGTSGFKTAVTPQLGIRAQVAHNSFLSVLVEQGLLGFVLYTAMFLSVFWAVLRLPRPERRFALVLLGTLTVTMLPLTWEDQKQVWFVMAALVGLAAAPDLMFAAAPAQTSRPYQPYRAGSPAMASRPREPWTGRPVGRYRP
ncbi:MAG TPA: O-antigen ligase family protein [Gemmatimonadales bacterium]|nr:O-antigen ligase family protein [Gemmatimonadales bacterium]